MILSAHQGFMAKNKPYDAEVEYLESTGTQWVDTGIEPNTELAFSGEFISFGSAYGNNYANIQGVREGDGNASVDQFSFTVSETSVNNALNWVGFGAFQATASCPNQLFEEKRISVVYDKTGLTVGGVKMASYSGKTITSLGRTIYLFGRNTQGFVNPFVGRLYSAKYTLNGVLVRDFIPVRKGKIGYLYDRVSGELFGNQGSGEFIVGFDKDVLSADVEYLETPYGKNAVGSFIDTGVIADTDVEFELKCKYNEQVTNLYADCIFGFRDQTGIQWRYMVTNYNITSGAKTGYAAFFNNQRFPSTISTSVDGEYIFSLKNGVFSNGREEYEVDLTQQPPSTIQSNWTLYLFAGNYQKESIRDNSSHVRVYYLKLWKGGQLVRDFVPIRIGNVGYMYDKVTGVRYANKGQYAFLVGPDKQGDL